MEVKPGYQQTEAGVIPLDWNLDYIENLAHVTTGGRNTQDRVDDGQYPFFVRSQTVERINSYSYDGEAILTAGDGVGTGKVFHYIKGKFDAHQRVYRISEFSDRIDGYFFYLYFSSHFYSRIMQMTAKSSVDSVRREMIARMPIPLPSTKAEQEAIAEALSDVDALIGSLDKLIAKKRDLKQAAMQQLLTGKKRLPDFKSEWDVACLGNKTTKIGSGITPTGGEKVYRQTGRPFLRSQNVGWGVLLLDDIAFIDDDTHASFQSTEIDIDDVFLNITGASIGRSAVADSRVTRGNVNQHVCIIRTVQEQLNPHFLNYYLLSHAGQRQIDSFQAGGNRQGLNFGQIRSLRIELPPLPEQTAIATVLSDMDAEITAFEQKRDKTRLLKQGMMQQLLTGRVRLVTSNEVQMPC
jgi:type I restriction enzyme S subunit